ncbi:hypothetical protein [Streptomyces bikiniensis]|uniref:hypothetical protein n=1 Tax=Streptomyces bikiniensis TaxID=1896 RepID=UPI0004BED293|nr:hypothetical protein [Streptomyces bikiniensis]
MSLEWDGFRLSLDREGLVLAWSGGYLQAGVTRCLSAVVLPPEGTDGRHRLVFRFRFPGAAAGAESVVVRTDVPPDVVGAVQRFVDLLWREYSVPNREEAEPGRASGEDPDTEPPASEQEQEQEPEPEEEEEAGAGAAGEAELERVPDAPGWIVSPAGPRSEELFRDVMARPAHSDR